MRSHALARASEELRTTTSDGGSSRGGSSRGGSSGGGSSRRGSLEIGLGRRISIACKSDVTEARRTSDMTEARRTSLLRESGISIVRKSDVAEAAPVERDGNTLMRLGSEKGLVVSPCGGPLSARLPASCKSASSRGSLRTAKLDGSFFDRQPSTSGSERSVDPLNASPPSSRKTTSRVSLKSAKLGSFVLGSAVDQELSSTSPKRNGGPLTPRLPASLKSASSRGSLKSAKLGSFVDQEPLSLDSERSVGPLSERGQGNSFSASLPASVKLAASGESPKSGELDGNFFDQEPLSPGTEPERSPGGPLSAGPPSLKTAASRSALKAVLTGSNAVDHAALSAAPAVEHAAAHSESHLPRLKKQSSSSTSFFAGASGHLAEGRMSRQMSRGSAADLLGSPRVPSISKLPPVI